jgi:hypothetical protein
MVISHLDSNLEREPYKVLLLKDLESKEIIANDSRI